MAWGSSPLAYDQIIRPKKFDAHGNSSVLSEDNVDGSRNTYRVRIRSRALAPNCTAPCGVSPIPPSPPRTPQVDVSNAELH
ncbi:hypothetical protein FXO37_10045 [Capsicum annuum]|nr:hypothetical protein FXO37_10045 [Capsicum annuum]